MEQHPVPRNITGFQFHLVGDMTLKQFGYLAAGIILAYLCYRLPLPSIITLPIAGTIALIGVSFAFVPIQERPLDRWVVAFIKSIYAPTQYLWHKDNPAFALLTTTMMHPQLSVEHHTNYQIANQKLNAYLSSLPQSLDTSVSLRERAYVDKTMSLFDTAGFTPIHPSLATTSPHLENSTNPTVVQPGMAKLSFQARASAPVAPAPKAVTPLASGQEKREEIKPKVVPLVSADTTAAFKQEEKLKAEAIKLKEELSKQTISKDRFLELEQKLSELLTEKERLTSEITKLRQTQTDPRVAVKPSLAVESKVESTVKTISARQVADIAGMPSVPQVGNVILGVVRDNLKRLLPGIIVTVKDPSSMPVRALKTNKLGQFAAATPLPNGTYLIEIEDPQKRYQFELIEVALDGSIFYPFEVVAKGEREQLRDKLTKELFGTAQSM